ncbi:MAG: hypothetical protein KGJ07_00500 [Patescibacteria group bacterium]|nr:hypothetical protein [Patescibacteria group bacterium]
MKINDICFVIIPLAILGFVIGFTIGNFGESKAFGLGDSIAFTSPTVNQIILDNAVSFTGTFSATSTPTIQIKVDTFQTWIPVSPISSNTWAVTLDGLPDGQHSATIWMQDTQGNFTDNVYFNIVTTKQTPTKYNMILPLWSPICQTLIKNHIPSNCPTLDQLAPFDTSNQTVSGHFIKDAQGHIIGRSNPQVKNYWAFFSNAKNRVVCVECSFDFSRFDTVQIIWFEPHGFEYVQQAPILNGTTSYSFFNGTQYVSRNIIDTRQTGTLQVGFDRNVSPDCLNVNEVFSPALFADTIYYLNSGCTKTNFNMTKTIMQIQPVIDIAHSRQYIDSQWLKQELVKNTGNCITQKCTPTKDPNSNW